MMRISKLIILPILVTTVLGIPSRYQPAANVKYHSPHVKAERGAASSTNEVPTNPCPEGEKANCLTCKHAASDEECERLGEYKQCSSNKQICFRLEQQNSGGEGNVRITKGCKPISACENAALGPDNQACDKDAAEPAATNCLNCDYNPAMTSCGKTSAYKKYNGKVYAYIDTLMTMGDAEVHCRDTYQEGHLVSIHSSEEDQVVSQYVQDKGGMDVKVWIGINDKDEQGKYVWTDDSPVDYTNWYKSGSTVEPNNVPGDGAGTHLRYQNNAWVWRDTHSGNSYKFVCKASGSPDDPTSTGSSTASKVGTHPCEDSGGRSFTLVDTPMSLSKADQFCMDNLENGHLASILTESDNNFVNGFIKKKKVPTATLR